MLLCFKKWDDIKRPKDEVVFHSFISLYQFDTFSSQITRIYTTSYLLLGINEKHSKKQKKYCLELSAGTDELLGYKLRKDGEVGREKLL